MLNMHTFHKWLSSTAHPNDDYQHHLGRLTQSNRDKIVNTQSDLTWVIWSNAPAADVQ